MAWSTDYRVSNVEFNGTIIGGVQSNSIAANAEIRRDVANGSLHARTASLQSLSPVGTFQTFDIAGAIDAFGLNGKCIDGVTGPLHNYYQLQQCEGPAAGAVHVRYTVTDGLLFPRTLAVNHRGDAQITYEVRARFDGTNDPVIKTGGQTISVSPNADARFTMGQFDIPSIADAAIPVLVEGKRSININFNGQASSSGADSEIFDRVQSLDQILPTTTISGVELGWLDTLVAAIQGRSVNNVPVGPPVELPVNVYLRKRNTPDATAEHIRLTQQGLIYWDSLVDGSVGQSATSSFSIDAVEDSTNKPIVPNTAIVHP